MKEYTPERNVKIPIALSAGLIICAIPCFLLSALDIGIRMLWQLTAMAALVISVQILTRFVLTTYSYVIDYSAVKCFTDEFNRIGALEGDGGLWLKIVRTQGKKQDIVGGFPLSSVISCVNSGDNSESGLKSDVKHSFNFCNSIFCKKYCTATVIINGEKLSAKLECDRSFLGK